MKLLKLIPVAAIVLTAFITFEAKADYPSGYRKKTSCTSQRDGNKYYKLQKTDETASYGVFNNNEQIWEAQYVSYNSATDTYKELCYCPNDDYLELYGECAFD